MGNKAGDITVGNTGRCVVDGAFKDIEATYYDVKLQPHCLSRGFRDDDGNLGVMDGRTISPDSIDEVLALDDYERFVKEMESRVHDTIPFGIGGDFETFTAPYNPLFFLHHTQLDRLWWLWQQRKPEERLSAYSGHNHRHPIEMASLDDKIDMRGLAPNVRVRSVMDTEGDFLCYRY
jgi:tyrosinase